MKTTRKTEEELAELRATIHDRLQLNPSSMAECTKMIREATGLSQVGFAAKVGLSKAIIARIETGQAQNLTISTMEAIGAPFGLKIGFLPKDTWAPRAKGAAQPKDETLLTFD